MSTRTGWVCPRCDEVISPDVERCDCSHKVIVRELTPEAFDALFDRAVAAAELRTTDLPQ